MAKTAMTMSLPKVGERLTRVMTSTTWDLDGAYQPEPCVVTYVNNAHNWFKVKFLDSGIEECYNVPTFDHSIIRNTIKRAIPVMCIETGFVYSSLDECADDMKLAHDGISRYLKGERGSCGGYHFCTVL